MSEAVWERGIYGYRLREGAHVIAVIVPVKLPGQDGWHAARIDGTGQHFFPYLKRAVDWCEEIEWYGPVKVRVSHNALRNAMRKGGLRKLDETSVGPVDSANRM